MNRKLILLVEDNPDDELLALRALKNNHLLDEVIVVHDGVEALDYLFCKGIYADRDKTVMPQLILLDLKLPRMNGLELLQRIRTDDRTKLLPVVILTSSNEERDLFNSYSLGANSYIRKPVNFVQFTKAIHQLKSYWLALNEPPPLRGAGR
jgi:two-component system response regulator